MTEIVIFILLIFIIILFLVIFAISGLYIFDILQPAPFVATKKEVVKKMIEAAKIKAGDKVLDLGSGDGRLVIEAAKLGAVSTGVEKNPFLVLLSRIKAKLLQVKVKIILGDIFSQDLSSSDIIFLYLNPKLLAKLSPRLKKEGKAGAKVVSNTYEIPSWKFTRKFDSVFLYKI